MSENILGDQSTLSEFQKDMRTFDFDRRDESGFSKFLMENVGKYTNNLGEEPVRLLIGRMDQMDGYKRERLIDPNPDLFVEKETWNGGSRITKRVMVDEGQEPITKIIYTNGSSDEEPTITYTTEGLPQEPPIMISVEVANGEVEFHLICGRKEALREDEDCLMPTIAKDKDLIFWQNVNGLGVGKVEKAMFDRKVKIGIDGSVSESVVVVNERYMTRNNDVVNYQTVRVERDEKNHILYGSGLHTDKNRDFVPVMK